MEILHKFKKQGYFTAELYHLLSKKKLSETYDEVGLHEPLQNGNFLSN